MEREEFHSERTKLFIDKRTLTLTFVVFASFTHGLCAQVPELSTLPITPEPVGSGARALGQSAFIAVADDATAASWNPAGLTNLEKSEASFVGAWRDITKDYSGSTLFDRDSWSDSQINFMSYAQHLDVGNKDVVISGNYHQVYNFGVEVNALDQSIGLERYGRSKGAISAYTLAGGWILNPDPGISVGAGFNWYTKSLHNDYAWQVKTMTTIDFSGILITETDDLDTFDDFDGYNFTFGLLWDVDVKPGNLLTLGLVYHTPFTAKVKRDFVANTTTTDFTQFPFPLITSSTQSWSHDMDIEFPASLGAGVNYRFTKRLNVAFDVDWKDWSKFKQKYPDGRSTSPIDNSALAYRLGGQYLILPDPDSASVLACRGGAFHEPRPIADESDLLPIYGLSTGLGWTLKERFSLDFAYQYRWAKQDLGNTDYDYDEHMFLNSLIIYF
jgi:long-subunit fatty acid transport protein